MSFGSDKAIYNNCPGQSCAISSWYNDILQDHFANKIPKQICLTFQSGCSCWWPDIVKCWGICIHTLRPRQNGRHFPDNIFKYIFLNEKVLILIKISLKFFPKCSINNISVLVQIMAWRWPGDKPLTEPMVVSFPTHICVTRPQWVKHIGNNPLQWVHHLKKKNMGVLKEPRAFY